MAHTYTAATSTATITLGKVPAGASRVRYEWYGNACGLGLFGCAVYTSVPPLPGSGQVGLLPLAPFVADLGSTRRALRG